MTLPISLSEETARINKLNLEAFYSYSNEKDICQRMMVYDKTYIEFFISASETVSRL